MHGVPSTAPGTAHVRSADTESPCRVGYWERIPYRESEQGFQPGVPAKYGKGSIKGHQKLDASRVPTPMTRRWIIRLGKGYEIAGTETWSAVHKTGVRLVVTGRISCL